MTKTDIVTVAIKIFGLYYATQLISHLIEFLFMLSGSSAFYAGLDLLVFYGSIFVTIIVEGGISYVAMFRSKLIVSRIMKQNSSTVKLETDKIDLMEIALAVVGVVAVTFAIPELLKNVVEMVYFREKSVLDVWTKESRKGFFLAIFTIAAGIFLIMNARNFAGKIVRHGKDADED